MTGITYGQRVSLYIIITILIGMLLLGCVTVDPTDAAASTEKETALGQLTETSGDNATTAEEGRITLDVDAIICTDCYKEIQLTVNDIEGVDFIFIDAISGTADVFFDPEIIQNSEVIQDELMGAGYRTSVIAGEEN